MRIPIPIYFLNVNIIGIALHAAVRYELKAFPHNVPVSPSGDIVAKNLRGQALQKGIAPHFGNERKRTIFRCKKG